MECQNWMHPTKSPATVPSPGVTQAPFTRAPTVILGSPTSVPITSAPIAPTLFPTTAVPTVGDPICSKG